MDKSTMKKKDEGTLNFLPGGTAWAKATLLPSGQDRGESADTVAIVRGNLYHVPASYTRARKAKDPSLAPHGLLRALRFGEQSELMRFLRECGPLEWKWERRWSEPGAHEHARRHPDEEPVAHVRAVDFWQKQLHFMLVARLWETWADTAQLQDAYVNLALNRERLAAQTWVRLIPFLRLAAGLDKLVPDNRAMLWTRPGPEAAAKGLDFEEFVGGIRKAAQWWLRHWAAMLIQAELDAHSENRQPVWYWQGSEETRVWFRMSLTMNTLWEGVWELLALDLAEPLGWRVCPHCGKLFYPPRKDRLYCTPEQQALASKRDWARKYRSQVRGKVVRKGGKSHGTV